MSATLDGARVAALLGDAPVVESEGRAFPVETRYLGRDPRAPIERQVADAIERALRAETGLAAGISAGRRRNPPHRDAAEGADQRSRGRYRRALRRARSREQDRAISPAPPGRRKVVLATSIAETSLTIEGVRVVIDSGLSRVPRYEPDVGLTRLETVRVSRAAADQRRGRAGRTEPGVCYRLWDEPQTASLEPYARPEILSADLSSSCSISRSGARPIPASLRSSIRRHGRARRGAGACWPSSAPSTPSGRITEEGRKLRRSHCRRGSRAWWSMPRPKAPANWPPSIAAVVTERGLGGDDVDLRHRLDSFRRDRSRRADDARAMVNDGPKWPAAGLQAASIARRLAARLGLSGSYREKSRRRQWQRSSSPTAAAATVDPASPLAREPYLAVAELTGAAAASRIVLAAAITLDEIEARFAGQIEERRSGQRSMRRRHRFGRAGCAKLARLILSERTVPVASGAEAAKLLAEGIAGLGVGRLPWSKAQLQFRDRVNFLRRAEGDEWPDLSNQALARTAIEWLTPFLDGKTALSQIGADDLAAALDALVPWNLRKRLDAEAPTHFSAPSGSNVPIDYEGEEGPKLAIRVQELFGLAVHPVIAGGRVPLLIELLSPAHRPVQVTRDLPGFWRGSYKDVRSDLRGRYPKHPWPDDPLSAPATRRAKPRGH